MHKLIRLGPYKGLALPSPVLFTEDDLELGVSEAVKKMANQWARVHWPAAYGDEVVINLRAQSDKLFVPELSKAHYTFTLGDPSIYKEFNQLIGLKAGDDLQLVLELPSGFPVERMRGKIVTFYITLLEVIRKRPLELTDEIACQIDPKAGDLEQLKSKLREAVSENWQRSITEAREKAILNTISSTSVYELDQQELKAVSDRIFDEKQKQLFTSDNPQMLEALLSGDNRSLSRESQLLAEELLVAQLILKEIARIEKIQVESWEFQEAWEELLKLAGNEQSLRLIFPTDDALQQHLLQEKVLDCLWEWNNETGLPDTAF
ncbi:trigger factor [Desulfitobacterium chlororespirans]|uniref:Trigger factor n=1 Tax=Desulfitobacterium chlororespirans DSM 11544 TaxID=1121395 RepID=A0A1M7RV37_9FIRM|nr:trigger factor [Desulfitobacterium chlororespirans]SHN50145.1 trigger factor [Desulfitobacterium chlororespirans DSM 11544]